MSLEICTNEELVKASLNLNDAEQAIIDGIHAGIKEHGIINVNIDAFEEGEFDSKPASRFSNALKLEKIDGRAVKNNKNWIRCQIPSTE